MHPYFFVIWDERAQVELVDYGVVMAADLERAKLKVGAVLAESVRTEGGEPASADSYNYAVMLIGERA